MLLLVLSVAAQSPSPESITVTFTGGGSISTVASLQTCTAVGIITDAAWTTASIALTASVDGTNYYTVYDQFGSLVSLAAASSRWIALSPSDTWGFRYIKLASVDGSGNAVAQTATRTLKVICRK